eukprot:IDg8691t1
MASSTALLACVGWKILAQALCDNNDSNRCEIPRKAARGSLDRVNSRGATGAGLETGLKPVQSSMIDGVGRTFARCEFKKANQFCIWIFIGCLAKA